MTKAELIDYAIRTGAPMEVVENLQAIEDEGEIYESIEEVWSDYPQTKTSSGTKTNTKNAVGCRQSAIGFF